MNIKFRAKMIFAVTCLAGPSLAAEDFCGFTYSVASGDTLSALSNKTFGNPNLFLQFYDNPINAEVLGADPNKIQIGDEIILPQCDGEVVVTEAPERVVNEALASINIVTGSDNYPFTDKDLEAGGLLSQVVLESFDESELSNPIKIDYINDWNSHLDTLLPNGAYALAFPWYKPHCDKPETLNVHSKKRCELVWSDSLFSIAIGFYLPDGIENPPLTFEDLKGKTICRPNGGFPYDLEENGLIDGETITLVRASNADECFAKLEAGAVDTVSVDRFAAGLAISNAGLTDLIIPSGIVSTQTMHMVAEPDNAQAVEWIEQLNSGLEKLRASGRYLEIVNSHFGRHNELIDTLNGGE